MRKMPYQAVFRAEGGALDPKLKTALQYIWEDIARYVNQDASPFTSGTLFPDERPSDLTTDDEDALFFSTDFNRFYRWTGTAWIGIGDGFDYIAGFRTAPTVAGWHLADGSTNVRRSNEDGTTSLITVPNALGDTFLRFAAAYSGPNATAAVAPTLSGTSSSTGSHTHGVFASGNGTGTTDAGVAPHSHSISFSTGAGSPHSHTQGTTGSGGSHDHTIGAGTYWDSAAIEDHTHLLIGDTDANSSGHTHTNGSTSDNDFSTTAGSPSGEGDVEVAADPHTHTVGSTGDESNTHTHGLPTHTGVSDDLAEFLNIPVTVTADGDHTHTNPNTASENTHTHDVSGATGVSTTTSHNHTITTLAVTVTGGTDDAGDHSHGVGSYAVSTTGTPKSEAFIPYLRL